MSEWQRTLDISDLWTKRNRGELALQDLARGIGQRLLALQDFGKGGFKHDLDLEREDIAYCFNTETFEETAQGIAEFDGLMSELYDWADHPVGEPSPGFIVKRACWVKTR